MPEEKEKHYADASLHLKSKHLKREKRVDLFLPPASAALAMPYRVLVLNDGQDCEALHLHQTLDTLYAKQRIYPVLVAAVHANDRLHEYGTAGIPDYANRGSQADAYTAFVLHELLPELRKQYNCLTTPEATAMAGCSLGGLSAFDVVWHHPQVFGKVGAFSAAFWWRRHSKNDELANIDRIIHSIVRSGYKREGLNFWFQAGTDDEKEDRNKNGIIDSIEDTLDLIAELAMKGYEVMNDIRYVEVQGGQHNQRTWGRIMPDFLTWAFGK